MPEFALYAPTASEAEDAIETLEDILRLDAIGEIDIPPYLQRVLVQLEELLSAAADDPVASVLAGNGPGG